MSTPTQPIIRTLKDVNQLVPWLPSLRRRNNVFRMLVNALIQDPGGLKPQDIFVLRRQVYKQQAPHAVPTSVEKANIISMNHA